MENHFKVLAAEVTAELEEINKIVQEYKDFSSVEGLDPNKKQYNVRVLGSILHDFYTGIERIFRRIATSLDGEVPTGSNWHSDLLMRMTLEIPNTRPRVIDESLADDIHEYLRFRHLFRNLYGFKLKWERIKPLVSEMERVFADLKRQVGDFLENFAKIP
ncbi:MAG: hypothetical protein ACTSU5_02410 [Promethearchaeota archaeon]